MIPYNIPKFYNGNIPCLKNGNNINLRNGNIDDRNGLLLPLLFGAAVGFPLGFIASNSKNQGSGYPIYPQPYYQPYPVYQQPYPMVNPMPIY